jgi:hypothetical protein
MKVNTITYSSLACFLNKLFKHLSLFYLKKVSGYIDKRFYKFVSLRFQNVEAYIFYYIFQKFIELLFRIEDSTIK